MTLNIPSNQEVVVAGLPSSDRTPALGTKCSLLADAEKPGWEEAGMCPPLNGGDSVPKGWGASL